MTKWICKDCLTDQDLQAIVQDNLENNVCDFCKATSERYISADAEKIIDQIVVGLRRLYIDPGELLFSSDDYGWSQVLNSDELLMEFDFPSSSEGFAEYFVEETRELQWFKETNYYHSDSDALALSWQEFSDYVKHVSRYDFLLKNVDFNFWEPQVVDPQTLFKRIKTILLQNNRISELPVDTVLYRARSHQKNKIVDSISSIGPPPKEYCKFNNRFSPAGIPVFYGSFLQETAISEVVKEDELVTIGLFTTKKPLHIADLSGDIQIPGLFGENATLIEECKFLNSLASMVSQPIDYAAGNVEYVPTQIAIALLRNELPLLDGFIYSSVKNYPEKNLILFITQDDCTENMNETGKSLYLEQILRPTR